jgi:hypothetical protein
LRQHFIESVGIQKLKNIAEEIEVFQAVRQDYSGTSHSYEANANVTYVRLSDDFTL